MPPHSENPDRITYFAQTDARGKNTRFGIKAKDRSKHMYVIGKTGMGKSTLLENMAIQDIQNGEGLALIDPHGSTAEKLLDYVPEDRVKDVLYFAPFDMEYPVAFNVMEDVGYDKRHLVVSGLMSAFKKIWVDAWSGRMEYILSNTLLALLEYPDATLLDVNRMYTNKTFRKKVVDNIKDPLVRAFWVDEFATYTDRYTQEATPAIQNKVGQFTSNPVIRNIIGQPNSTFDLREIMDSKKIFIANLSKGRVGETNAQLLGSMLTTKIYLAAMSRADLPAQGLAKLPDFYFYVDEFQSVANESFADILSEARKYKLNLIIAHQYVEQMEENVRNAVFGNVGTTVTFRVGPFDAEVLETIFAPKFTAQDLVNLAFAQIYLSLMIDGVGSKPFSATTLPPIDPPHLSYRDQIIHNSRTTFARPRETVEQEVEARTSTIPGEAQGDTEGMKNVAAKRASETNGNRRETQRAEPGARRERTPSGGEQRAPRAVTRDSRRDNRGGGGGEKKESLKDVLGGIRHSAPQSPKQEERASPEAGSEAHLEELRSVLSRIAKTEKNKEEKKNGGNGKASSEHIKKKPLEVQQEKKIEPVSPPPKKSERSETLPPKKESPSSASLSDYPKPTGSPPNEVPEDVLRKVINGETD